MAHGHGRPHGRARARASAAPARLRLLLLHDLRVELLAQQRLALRLEPPPLLREQPLEQLLVLEPLALGILLGLGAQPIRLGRRLDRLVALLAHLVVVHAELRERGGGALAAGAAHHARPRLELLAQRSDLVVLPHARAVHVPCT